ncbi:MAG: lipoprotein-releasing ABC transporter permease subunit [Alphaproteobacteria bacterium]
MTNTPQDGGTTLGRRGGIWPLGGRTSAFAPFEWLLALRYLGAKRKESFVSVNAGFSFFGIMLGVAVLIVVMAVMNGFRTELLGKILGVDGHAFVYATAGPLTDFDQVANEIRDVPGVTRVSPLVEGEVLVSANGVTSGALVRGIRPEDLQSMETVAPSVKGDMATGTLDNFKGSRNLAVGSKLAQRFGLRVGDKLTLIAPEGPVTPFGAVPRRKAYRVVAIFEVGMHQYDNTFIFMPLEQARLFFGTNEGVHKLEVMVDDPDQVRKHALAMLNAVDAPVRINTWQQVHSSFFNALQVERTVMFFILLLIIIIAAFNIVSGLIMLVRDKNRDIAVLRTMGATSGTIMRVFLIAGASVGVAGTLAGFVLGVVLSNNVETINKFMSRLTGTKLFDPVIYFLSELPAEINNGEVAAVVIAALVIALLAPVYPAWRAAKTDPVDALRYE